MRKNSIKLRAKEVPADIKLLVSKSMATAKQINYILEKQGKSQRDLANMLGKKESEISKWMQGTHNFTYKTICKIEVALGEQIIVTTSQANQIISYHAAVVADIMSQKVCSVSKEQIIARSLSKNQKFSLTSSNFAESSLVEMTSVAYGCMIN